MSFEEFKASFPADKNEVNDDELEAVAGGGVYDGNNTGWYYGKCRNPECSGSRFVMQINFKNLIACTTCGDWVEF